MKNFGKLLLVVLITLSYSNTYSQDENNPWQFSFGVSAVDLDVDSQSEFADFFAVDENWNVSSGLSMFTLSKYLGNNLSVGLSGSVNSISNFADGYEFVKWTGDNTSSDPTMNIIMSSDKSVTAIFAEPSFLVELTSNAGDYMIYKSTNSGSSWSKVSSGGTRMETGYLQPEYGEGLHF